MSNHRNAPAAWPKRVVLTLWLGGLAGLLAAIGLIATHNSQAADVVVYKSPTCGCCNKWVDHLQQAGFSVEVHDLHDLGPVKAEHAIPPSLRSCHTATVDGYVVEGHVPADLVQRLLEERPPIRGLAVPGMPMGSPGMEGPYKDAYEVLAIAEDGRTSVYVRR
jgi:hypothetical protein